MKGSRPATIALLAAALATGPAWPVSAQTSRSPRVDYQRLLARERTLTARGKVPAQTDLRALVVQYERFVWRHPRSGYSDNALWQGAQLARMIHARSKRVADRETARRLLDQLVREYPSSSLLPRARVALKELILMTPGPGPANVASAARAGAPSPPLPSRPVAPLPAAPVTPAPVPTPEADAAALVAPPGAAASPPAETASKAPGAMLLDVRRTVLPELVRVTLEIDREVTYYDERLDGPPRVFFDLRGVAPSPGLDNSILTYPDDVVRQIRVGARADATTRVVLDLDGASRYSVFTLYGPYRLVIDVVREAGTRAGLQPSAPQPDVTRASLAEAGLSSSEDATRTTTRGASAPAGTGDAVPAVNLRAPGERLPEASTPAATSTATVAPPPGPPAATAGGSFSLARQLGLGVSRIVIDPGHGGHDPGALGKRITEAELVLDVALRLEKLLARNPAFEVVLTRRTDVYVPLEERTAIANRANADLFLSIHANASRNAEARGIETYFLNFASTPDAEAVAARENAASGRSMHHLPDIVKAIALNNKLDESRELARIVQTALVKHVRGGDKGVRDLGVKQAPFVVLIGALMPSVLAEISFITNPRDVQLLRTGAHRQKIAESLFEAIVKYQRTLKASETVASQ